MKRDYTGVKYFTTEEMECPCCGVDNMHRAFVLMLDEARRLAGVPFVVTSGFRCPDHNRAVGGNPDSAHLVGLGLI